MQPLGRQSCLIALTTALVEPARPQLRGASRGRLFCLRTPKAELIGPRVDAILARLAPRTLRPRLVGPVGRRPPSDLNDVLKGHMARQSRHADLAPPET